MAASSLWNHMEINHGSILEQTRELETLVRGGRPTWCPYPDSCLQWPFCWKVAWTGLTHRTGYMSTSFTGIGRPGWRSCIRGRAPCHVTLTSTCTRQWHFWIGTNGRPNEIGKCRCEFGHPLVPIQQCHWRVHVEVRAPW